LLLCPDVRRRDDVPLLVDLFLEDDAVAAADEFDEDPGAWRPACSLAIFPHSNLALTDRDQSL